MAEKDKEASENMQNAYNDPLFLSPNESTQMQLSPMLFDVNNFIPWSRSVKLGLGAKNKLGFIDGVNVARMENNKEKTISSDERDDMEMETKNEEKEATDDDVVTWKMHRKLGSLRSSSVKCCIYKVPEFIRKHKEECYRPSVVSIGPIFYQDPQLQTMQELK